MRLEDPEPSLADLCDADTLRIPLVRIYGVVNPLQVVIVVGTAYY